MRPLSLRFRLSFDKQYQKRVFNSQIMCMRSFSLPHLKMCLRDLILEAKKRDQLNNFQQQLHRNIYRNRLMNREQFR